MQKPANFRDIGGIPGADGRTIRTGLLLRAAQPIALSESDHAALAAYNITNIVDFRRPWEVRLAPNDNIAGAAYTNLDVLAGMPWAEATLEEWLDNVTIEDVDKSLNDNYLYFVSAASARRIFADFLRICIDADGAVLFHCHAGKDRTGMAAAILLKLLGTSNEDVFADYMRTLDDIKTRLSGVIDGYRRRGLDKDKLAALEVVYGIKREYLDASFAAANAQFGDFAGYITNGLGINDSEIATLQKKYLM